MISSHSQIVRPRVDDVLARYVRGLLEASSASFDWAKVSTQRPDRSASQVKISFE
ncbi:hypothetical protein ACVIHA_003015 [Bradyrhizobium liaoningense]